MKDLREFVARGQAAQRAVDMLIQHRKVPRPFLHPDGRRDFVMLKVCACDDRRGPADGVCGNCGGAIP